jgi:hypothetical protein
MTRPIIRLTCSNPECGRTYTGRYAPNRLYCEDCMHARAVARLTGSYAPRVDGYHVDSLAIITLTCVDCKREYSGPYRKHRQRCPDCKAEWAKKCHRESYQRLSLERGW